MASGRIKGITIEIGGDTTGLQKALAGVDKSLNNTSKSLKDVNKLLKLDPGNVDLLKQKQDYLASAIGSVKEKLDIEKQALEQLKNADPSEENAEKQRALEREIIATEQALDSYEDELKDTQEALKNTDRAAEDAAVAQDNLEKETKEAGDASRQASDGWSMGKQALVDLAEKGAALALDAIKRLAKAMVDAVNDATDFADEILTLSHTTHLSTDTLQEFQYMSDLVDVSLDTVSGSLTKLTNNMQSAASGSGAAYEAFQALGVSVTDSNGHLRTAEDVFYDIIDALGEMENQTERDAFSMDIFGRSAQDLNPLIDAGADAIADFAQEAHDMGYVLDRDALEALGATNDAFDRIGLQMEAVRNQIIAEMAPAIEEIADAFLEWAQTVDWSDVARKIGEVAQAVADVVMFVIDHKDMVIAGIIAVTGAIVALTVAQIAMNVAMTANPIGLIIMLIGGLVAAFVALEERTHMFRDFFTQMGEQLREVAEGIRDAFIGAIEKVKQVWETIKGFFAGIWQTITGIFSGVKEFFVGRFQAAFETIRGIWSGITGFFSGLWSGITGIFSNVAGFFTTVFEGARTAIGNIVSGIVGIIKAPINAIIRGINVFISGLNRIRIPSWVPAIGGRGINISQIPYLARGGVLEKGQVGLLEGSGAEAVVPLDQNTAWIRAVARDMAAEIGTNQTINITVNAAEGQSAEAVANAVMRKLQNAVNRQGAVYA